jgi:hypothetical protein
LLLMLLQLGRGLLLLKLPENCESIKKWKLGLECELIHLCSGFWSCHCIGWVRSEMEVCGQKGLYEHVIELLYDGIMIEGNDSSWEITWSDLIAKCALEFRVIVDSRSDVRRFSLSRLYTFDLFEPYMYCFLLFDGIVHWYCTCSFFITMPTPVLQNGSILLPHLQVSGSIYLLWVQNGAPNCRKLANDW